MVNQYSNPEYKNVIKDLKKQLIKLRKESKEDDSNHPEIQEIINNNLKGTSII